MFRTSRDNAQESVTVITSVCTAVCPRLPNVTFLSGPTEVLPVGGRVTGPETGVVGLYTRLTLCVGYNYDVPKGRW